MSMSGSKSRLAGATKELALKWEQTKNDWRDQKNFSPAWTKRLSSWKNWTNF
jgi:hypothetical protein